MKYYLELTVSYDDATELLEASRREKVDEEEPGEWGEPTEVEICASTSLIALPWIQLEMKLEV